MNTATLNPVDEPCDFRLIDFPLALMKLVALIRLIKWLIRMLSVVMQKAFSIKRATPPSITASPKHPVVTNPGDEFFAFRSDAGLY